MEHLVYATKLDPTMIKLISAVESGLSKDPYVLPSPMSPSMTATHPVESLSSEAPEGASAHMSQLKVEC